MEDLRKQLDSNSLQILDIGDVQGEIINCGKSSIQAVDTFFKMFAVFGIPVHKQLGKLMEFLEIITYNIKNCSSTQTVQRLVVTFSESLLAETSDDEII